MVSCAETVSNCMMPVAEDKSRCCADVSEDWLYKKVKSGEELRVQLPT